MKRGYIKIILPVFIACLAFIFTAKIFAQTNGNYDVTVSPVFFDLTAAPNTQVSDKIRIRNNTSSPIPIKLIIQSIVGDLSGNISLKQEANNPAISWVKFQSDTITLRPLEWTDIPFEINVPKEAGYGYYFAISFAQDNESPIARNGAVITGAAAVPILLDVKKEGTKADARIVKFSVKNYVNEYLPVDFTVNVENTGNVHIKPKGNIFISNGSGKDIATLSVNDGGGNILPQSARVYDSSWDDGFLVNKPVVDYGQPRLDKNGKIEYKLSVNWDKLTSFRIGKYDANLILVFDNGVRDIPLQATISFWVFPYKFVVVALICLIILFLLARFALKAYVKKQIRKIGTK
jgi:hypothetical protein